MKGDDRVVKPTLDSVRRACARALQAEGFSRGKRAVFRDLGDGLVARVLVEGRNNGWVRGVGVAVSVHRTADYVEASARLGEPVRDVGDDDQYLPFGLSSDVGRLLPRPHDHEWVVEEAPDLDRLQEQLSLAWAESVQPHVQRWVGLLQVARTAAFLPRNGAWAMSGLCDPGLMRLSPSYVDRYFPGADPELVRPEKQRWLKETEVCPWSPCAELGRRVAAGGTWPDALAP